MPKDGFSINDYLNPKPRKYNKDFEGERIYRSEKISIGRHSANKIIKTLEISSTPIDLDLVKEYLMVKVTLIKNAPEGALGRFVGNGKIEIVEKLPNNLYRSTLAHELGHAALHHDTRNRWDTMESIKDQDPHEKEAWDFAGEILLPGALLQKELNANYNLEYLASHFNVSKDLLCVELSKRNLL